MLHQLDRLPNTVPEGYPTGKGPKPGDCCYTSNYAYCEGRPLVIDAEKRAARLSGDPSWG